MQESSFYLNDDFILGLSRDQGVQSSRIGLISHWVRERGAGQGASLASVGHVARSSVGAGVGEDDRGGGARRGGVGVRAKAERASGGGGCARVRAGQGRAGVGPSGGPGEGKGGQAGLGYTGKGKRAARLGFKASNNFQMSLNLNLG